MLTLLANGAPFLGKLGIDWTVRRAQRVGGNVGIFGESIVADASCNEKLAHGGANEQYNRSIG
jgi:hypothetical protein